MTKNLVVWFLSSKPRVTFMEKEYLLSYGTLKILCKIAEPDHGDIRRLVLGVHGFAGSSEDEIQVGIAEEMVLFRSAVLRFDFPAHGKSPVPDNALTVKNCVDSLLMVARFARERYPQVEDLCIFATGFGAYVTLIALEELLELPGRVKLVVQTPSVRMHETLLSMLDLSQEAFWVMGHKTIPVARAFDVTYRFYEELREHIALTSHPIPMLILHGESDDYIRMEDIRLLRRINEHSKLVTIPGTTHRFLEEGAWDMVLDLTRDWFEFEQVLLTDWT